MGVLDRVISFDTTGMSMRTFAFDRMVPTADFARRRAEIRDEFWSLFVVPTRGMRDVHVLETGPIEPLLSEAFVAFGLSSLKSLLWSVLAFGTLIRRETLALGIGWFSLLGFTGETDAVLTFRGLC